MKMGNIPAVCLCMTGWKGNTPRQEQAAKRPLRGIHGSEQRERGDRYVPTGCAATYPGGHRATRTGSADQAAGCWQYLRGAVESSGEQPARCFLTIGELSQSGEALTARAFLEKMYQAANLLADLGMGSQDVMALLLPDLLETQVLL
jgi:hypothetical protein